MKLSVVIVNYNVKYFLEQCLDAVLRSSKTIQTEIFVVDNHSADGSIDYLKPRFPQVTFIENEDNPGFAKANNQAIRFATGEYILLLNPDTVIGEDTLTRCCEFMDLNPEAGALGLKMVDGSGIFLPESKRGFPSPWNSFCKVAGLTKLFPNSSFFAKYHLKYLNENQMHVVDVLAGAFMFIRKKTLEQTGLLDEAFFMYGEDIDLSYRITRAGFRNCYLPEKIIHYKGESTKKDLRYVRIFYEAMLIFFRKYYPHHHFLFRFLVCGAVYFRAFLAIFDKIFIPKIRNKNKDKNKKNIQVVGNIDEVEQIVSLLGLEETDCVSPEEFKANPEYDSSREIVFCANRMEYKEIIDCMDFSKKKFAGYRIFHADSGTLISSNEVFV